MGECTSKDWGRGKKKVVKKKLTRAEVEALIPKREGLTASEAAGATDVIMAAMDEVSTFWEGHDDDDDKDDHHENQTMITGNDQVKLQDTVVVSKRTEVHQHNLEEVVKTAPSSCVTTVKQDNEKHDHSMICTTASSSPHSESLSESFEYIQYSDACLSKKEIEIESRTPQSEYLEAEQTIEKVFNIAPQALEHRDEDIIAMAHSTGLLESINKRIQALLQLELQSDTQVFREQDTSESERNQMKDGLTIGSTQQTSESYITNLQKALQLIRLKEAIETGREIGSEESFAPEKSNSSDCYRAPNISAETASADTILNLKRSLITDAQLGSLENVTVANTSGLHKKLVNASILLQEQIKEDERVSVPDRPKNHADTEADNSLPIEKKDISPVTFEDTINEEITPGTSTKTKDRKIKQNMECMQHFEYAQGKVQAEIPGAYEISPDHKKIEVQGQEHTSKTNEAIKTDSINTKQSSINDTLDSVNTKSSASLQCRMEKEARHIYTKETADIPTMPFPKDAIEFDETVLSVLSASALKEDKIEKESLPKGSRLQIAESSKSLSQAFLVVPGEEELKDTHNIVQTQSNEELIISNAQDGVMIKQDLTSEELHKMIKTSDSQEVEVTESIYETVSGSDKDQEVYENITPEIDKEPQLSGNTTKLVEQYEVSLNETQLSIQNEIATTQIESYCKQMEHETSSMLEYSIATADQEQAMTEILITDVEEEKHHQKIQQQSHPVDNMEALEIAQNPSSNQDSQNLIVLVYETLKSLPADDDQSQQLAEQLTQELMSKVENEFQGTEDSTTQEVHEACFTAPIPEVATPEVSTFERDAMTDGKTMVYETLKPLPADDDQSQQLAEQLTRELMSVENEFQVTEDSTLQEVHETYFTAPIPEIATTEISKLETDTMTNEKTSRAIETRNDAGLQVVSSTAPELAQQSHTAITEVIEMNIGDEKFEAKKVLEHQGVEEDSRTVSTFERDAMTDEKTMVYETLKSLPDDDDQSQQLAEQLTQELMSKVENEFQVTEDSTTWEAHETYFPAPIPEVATPEVSTFERDAMTDEKTMVYETLKPLPADDDQSQQMVEQLTREVMSKVENEFQVTEDSTTWEAHETYFTAPIPEVTTPEVSTIEMDAMTDEKTSHTIETRNNTGLEGMSSSAPELVQQSHTAITEVVEMNIGDQKFEAKTVLELQGVEEDSRTVSKFERDAMTDETIMVYETSKPLPADDDQSQQLAEQLTQELMSKVENEFQVTEDSTTQEAHETHFTAPIPQGATPEFSKFERDAMTDEKTMVYETLKPLPAEDDQSQQLAEHSTQEMMSKVENEFQVTENSTTQEAHETYFTSPIPEVATTEVSTFETDAMTHEKPSHAIETRNDTGLQGVSSTAPELAQQSHTAITEVVEMNIGDEKFEAKKVLELQVVEEDSRTVSTLERDAMTDEKTMVYETLKPLPADDDQSQKLAEQLNQELMSKVENEFQVTEDSTTQEAYETHFTAPIPQVATPEYSKFERDAMTDEKTMVYETLKPLPADDDQSQQMVEQLTQEVMSKVENEFQVTEDSTTWEAHGTYFTAPIPEVTTPEVSTIEMDAMTDEKTSHTIETRNDTGLEGMSSSAPELVQQSHTAITEVVEMNTGDQKFEAKTVLELQGVEEDSRTVSKFERDAMTDETIMVYETLKPLPADDDQSQQLAEQLTQELMSKVENEFQVTEDSTTQEAHETHFTAPIPQVATPEFSKFERDAMTDEKTMVYETLKPLPAEDDQSQQLAEQSTQEMMSKVENEFQVTENSTTQEAHETYFTSPIPEVATTEVSTFGSDAMTHEKPSHAIETRNDTGLQGVSSTAPELAQQSHTAITEVVEMNIGDEKFEAKKVLELQVVEEDSRTVSTFERDAMTDEKTMVYETLKPLPADDDQSQKLAEQLTQELTSKVENEFQVTEDSTTQEAHETHFTAPIPQVATPEYSKFERDAMTDEKTMVYETLKPLPADDDQSQQLAEQSTQELMSKVENEFQVTENFTTQEAHETYFTAPIPEVATPEVSKFQMDAVTDEKTSHAIETRNDTGLQGMSSTAPELAQKSHTAITEVVEMNIGDEKSEAKKVLELQGVEEDSRTVSTFERDAMTNENTMVYETLKPLSADDDQSQQLAEQLTRKFMSKVENEFQVAEDSPTREAHETYFPAPIPEVASPEVSTFERDATTDEKTMVCETLKSLPADDDQSPQLTEQLTRELMPKVENEFQVIKDSTTQEAHETYFNAPIPEVTTPEVSTFEMDAMTDEKTSHTIETRNDTGLQGMGSSVPELVQQSHTAITEVVEMNIGDEKFEAEKVLELEGVEEDSRTVQGKDEAKTFQSEENKLNEDSHPQASMSLFIAIDEEFENSHLIDFTSKEESVAMLQSPPEDKPHAKELAKELTSQDISNAEQAEVSVEASTCLDTNKIIQTAESLTNEVSGEVTICKRDFTVLTDQEETVRSAAETTLTGVTSKDYASLTDKEVAHAASATERDMEDETENAFSNLEFQITEHMLRSQEREEREIDQIQYINKDEGSLKKALQFEIVASQNMETSENANKLSLNEQRSFQVPETNESMLTPQEDESSIQNGRSRDEVILSDDLTSDETDNIDQASVTENFESLEQKLHCETDLGFAREVLQTIKAATDNELQGITENTTQPMQHAQSTINENSSVLCDMITMTYGATAAERKDKEELSYNSSRLELPIHTDKEGVSAEKEIGVEVHQFQEEKLCKDNIQEVSKLENVDDSDKILETSDHCVRQELTDVIKVVQIQLEDEEMIKSNNQDKAIHLQHSTSCKVQIDSARDMFQTTKPATDSESQGRPESAKDMVPDNEAIVDENLSIHHDITAITHNAEAAESTSGHTERSFNLGQQMQHEKVLEQASQLLPAELAQPLEVVHTLSLDAESYGQVTFAQDISETMPAEGSQPQEPVATVIPESILSRQDTVLEPEASDSQETHMMDVADSNSKVEESKEVLKVCMNAMADQVEMPEPTSTDDLKKEMAAVNPLVEQKESIVCKITEDEASQSTESTKNDLPEIANTTTTPAPQHEAIIYETTMVLPDAVALLHVDTVAARDDGNTTSEVQIELQFPIEEDDFRNVREIEYAEICQNEEKNLQESSLLQTSNSKITESSETPEQMRGVQLSFNREEASCLHEIEKSNLTVQTEEFGASEAASVFDTGAMTNKINSPVIESGNNDVLGTTKTTTLVWPAEANLLEKMSSEEGSIIQIVTNFSAEIEKGTSTETPESTRDLQLSFEEEDASSSHETDKSNLMSPISEVVTSRAVSTFETGAGTDEDSSLVMETGNNKLLGMTKTVCTLVEQAEDTVNEQMSSIYDSVVVTQVAAGIEEETASEAPESTGDLQLSFEEREFSSSYKIDKSNLTVPIPEVEASEAFPTFKTNTITDEDTFPIVERGNNDLPEMTNTVCALVQQANTALQEQPLSQKDSVVAADVSALIKKESETVRETPELTRNFHLPFEEEETSNLHETQKSNLSVPIPEDEASEAVSPIDIGAMKDENISPLIETGYSDSPDLINSAPVLVQQVDATLHEKISSMEGSIVVTRAVAGTEKETDSQTSELKRNLQISIEEEEAPGSNETDESYFMISIPEVEASEAVSAFDTGTMTDEDSYPFIETGKNDLLEMANITPVLFQTAEATPQEQMSSPEDSPDVTYVAAGIEKGISSEIPQSTRDLKFSFEDQEVSCSHESNESNLTVQNLEVGASEMASVFDKGPMTDKDSSTAIESGNNDLQGMTNTASALVQKAEATLHEKMSSVEDLVVVTNVVARIENETVSKTPETTRDFQLPFEEEEASSSNETNKSNLMVQFPKVKASEAVSTFDKGAMTEDSSPVIGTENNKLLAMPNTVPTLVQQAEATPNEQLSSKDDFAVVTQVAAGIEKESASENRESMEDIQFSFEEKEASSSYEIDKSNRTVLILEVKAPEAVQIFETDAITDEDTFPVTETGNNDLLDMINNAPVLVQQAEATVHEEISSIENSIVETHAAGSEKETACRASGSTRDLQISLKEEEYSGSNEADESNIIVPSPEIEASEVVSTIDTGAMTDEESYPFIETGDNDLLGMATVSPVLVQTTEVSLHEQMSSAEMEKETSSEIPESTRELQISLEEREVPCSHESNESNLTAQSLTVEALEMASVYETGAMIDKDSSTAIESRNYDLLGMASTAPALVQQAEATLYEQMSSVEDLVVVTNVAAGIETPETTRDLQLSFEEKEASSSHEINQSNLMVPFPKVEASETVSIFDKGAMTRDSSLVIGTENDDFLGMPNTMPALVQQAEAILNEQMSSKDDSVIMIQVVPGIEKKTACETPESMEDLQILFEGEEASSSNEINKSNLTVLIPEVEASKAVHTFETDATTEEDTFPVVEIGNGDLPEMIDTAHTLVQQAEAALHEQMASEEDFAVVDNVATQIEKETVSETPESTRDLQLPSEEEETSNSHETNKSNLRVPISEDEPPEAISPFDTDAMKDKDTSLGIGTGNSNSLDMINNAPVLVQPTKATQHEKISSTEDSKVVAHAVAGTEMETAIQTSESTKDLQISIEEEEGPGSNETDESNLMIPVPAVEASEAVSAFDTGAMTDEDSNSFIEREDNDLPGIANIDHVLVQTTEAIRQEQMSSTEDSADVTHAGAVIEKEISSEILESTTDLQLSFEEQEVSCSHETDESNLVVQIFKVEALEAAPVFDTGAMTNKDSSTAIESGNNDLLGIANTAPALVQQAEAILHAQMSSVEDLVVVTDVAAGIEKETVSEIPEKTRDLQLPFEENKASSSHKTNKSSRMVPIPKVEATDAVSAFDKGAMTEDICPVIGTENIELLGMSNIVPALVQRAEATLNEQMSSVDNSVVVTQVAAGIEMETASETLESTEVLQHSYAEENIRNVQEPKEVLQIMTQQKDFQGMLGTTITLINDEVEKEEATANERTEVLNEEITHTAVVNEKFSESESPGAFSNSEILTTAQKFPALQDMKKEKMDHIHQYQFNEENLHQEFQSQISATSQSFKTSDNVSKPLLDEQQDLVVVADAAALIKKETAHETPESTRDLQLPSDEKETSNSHESDKSNLRVPISKDEPPEAISPLDTSAMKDEVTSLGIETGNGDSLDMINNAPVLVQQAETTLHEKISCTEDSKVATHAVAGTEMETANQTSESTKDLQISIEEEEGPESNETDESNLMIPVPEVEASEAVSAFDTGAMTDEDSNSFIEREDNDLPGIANIIHVLVQTAEAIRQEQMSSTEDSADVTHAGAVIEKEISSEILESTTDLQLSFEEQEVSCSHETDESNHVIQIFKVEASEAAPVFDTGAMTEKDSSTAIESGNNDLLGIANTAPALVQQAEAILHAQMSPVEDWVVVTDVAAGIEKETVSEIPEKTRDLQLPFEENEASSSHKTNKLNCMVPIPKVEATDAVSAFDKGAMTEDSCPVIGTENIELLGMSNTVPALVQQAEATLNEQMSSVDDSIVVTQVAAWIEMETASETPESTEVLQHSYAEENIRNVQEPKEVLQIMTQQKDFQGMLGTAITLINDEVEEEEATANERTEVLNEEITHTAVVNEKFSESESPGAFSNSDILTAAQKFPALQDMEKDKMDHIHQYQFNEENLHQEFQSQISAISQSFKTSDNVSKPLLDEQQDLVVVADAAALIEKETAHETPESTRDLQLPSDEKETSNSHESDKSNLRVPISKDEPPEAISPFDTGAIKDEVTSLGIETGNGDSLDMINNAPVIVQQAETTLHEKISCTEVSKVATHAVTGTEMETANQISESTKDLQISIEEDEGPGSNETDESNLMIPVPEVEASEAVSAFDTGAMTDEDSYPFIERGDDDLLGIANIASIPVQTAEATLKEQMSSTEDSVNATHVAAGIEKETSSEIPHTTRDLQMSFEEQEDSCLHETDESNLMVQIFEVEGLKAAPVFDTGAITEKDSSTPIESGNGDLLGMTNTAPAMIQQAEAILHAQMSSVENLVVITNVAAGIEKDTMSETPEKTRDLQFPFAEQEASSSHDTNESNLIVPIPKFEATDTVSAFDKCAMTEDSSPVIGTENIELLGIPTTVSALIQQGEATLNEQISSIDDLVVVTQVAAGIEKETASETPESTEDLQHSYEEEDIRTVQESKELLQSMTQRKDFQGMSGTVITLTNEEVEEEEATANERTEVLNEEITHTAVVNEKDSESESPGAFSNSEIQTTAQKIPALQDMKKDQHQFNEENLCQEIQSQITAISQSLKTSDNVSNPSLDKQLVNPSPPTYEPNDETRAQKSVSNTDKETIITEDSTLLVPVSIWKDDIILTNDPEVIQSIKLEDLQGMSTKETQTEQQNEATVNENPSILQDVITMINDTTD